MDMRSARVARGLADQGIDRRRGTSFPVFMAALLLALGICLARIAPSLASPRSASRGERDLVVRKHDERGNESDVLVLRDDHGDDDGTAMDRGRAHDHRHGKKHHKHGGKHHEGGGNDRHGGKGKHTRGHRDDPKGGTRHRTVGGTTGVHTRPGGTHVGGGSGGGGTNATGGTKDRDTAVGTAATGTSAATGNTSDATAATMGTTGGSLNPTGTGVQTELTCTRVGDPNTAPEPQTDPGEWLTNWQTNWDA